MIDVVWIGLTLLKAFLALLAGYLVYWRVIDYACLVRFYGKQGRDVCILAPWHMPMFGSIFNVVYSMIKSKREGDNYHVSRHVINHTIPSDSLATGIMFITNGAGLLISDPAVVQDLYVSKNKYFDKHSLVKNASYVLTGESILFTETTEDWRSTRKAMSPAFYKGKLESLTEIAKTAIETTVKRFEELLKDKNEIDILNEINTMTTRILLTCAFGVDIADEKIDFWVNGQLQKCKVGQSLSLTFNDMI